MTRRKFHLKQTTIEGIRKQGPRPISAVIREVVIGYAEHGTLYPGRAPEPVREGIEYSISDSALQGALHRAEAEGLNLRDIVEYELDKRLG